MPQSKLQFTPEGQPHATRLGLLSQSMTLGERIREAREYVKLSAPEMARRVGVSKQVYYRWEADEVGYIKPANLFMVAKISGYSPIWLQSERGEKLASDLTDTLQELVEVLSKLSEREQAEVLDFARFKATG